MRECVQHLCHGFARVYLCLSVCLFVCMHAVVSLWVCIPGVFVCIYVSMPAFTHVSMDVYYMRKTVYIYIYVAYDGYVLRPCREESAGSRGPQGSALAAASSALRRLHSLQFFLI